MKTQGIIAILGGMGPEASARLLNMLVEKSARDFGAKNGDDFPEVIVDSIPVADFISDKKNLSIASLELRNRIKKLNRFNPSCFGIACNTAHVLLPKLETVAKAPFISIIEEVASEVAGCVITKVGLLSSPMTIKTKLFEEALAKNGIKIVVPSESQQAQIEKIIRRVIAHDVRVSDKATLVTIANSLREKGAEGIILGCTELPLVFPKNFSLPVFDSLEILAESLLKKVLL